MSGAKVDFGLITKVVDATQGFDPGAVIFAEGDAGDTLYILKSGEIDLMHGDRLLRRIGPGEVFGEMALIDGSPRSATAVARSAAEVVPVTERQFLYLVGETPYFALNLLRVLADRLRHETAAA